MPATQSTTTNGSDCSRHRIRAAPNRFVYDDRHVQALRLIRLLRERRRLGLATIGRILPQLLAQDEQAFRARVWENVIATDVDDTTTEARARIVSSRAGRLDSSVRERERGRHLRRGLAWERARSTSSSPPRKTVGGRRRALVDDLVAALDARRPGHPLAAKTITTVLDGALGDEAPLLVEAALRGVHGKPEDARVARGAAATLRDAVARRLRRTPTEKHAVAAGQLVETCLAAPWHAWSPRRRSPDRALDRPACPRAAVAYNDLDHRVGNTRHHGGGR